MGSTLFSKNTKYQAEIMSESLNQRKRKSKGKFFMNSKKAKYSICPDQRGFLGFCNKFEKEAIKEARILFDEYLLKVNDDNEDNSNSDDSEIDEFDAADAEQEEIKKQSEKELDQFKLLNSGVDNVLFFKTKLKDPVKLSLNIMDDIISCGEQKTKFLLRFVPIEGTCKAHEENVREVLKKLLKKHFTNEVKKSYSVVFKARCNNDFKREMAINIVGDIIKELSPNSKVEFKTPDLVIMVEVMKSNCCLAVLPKYFDTYKKYNLIELAKVKKQDTVDEDTSQNVNIETDKEVLESSIQIKEESLKENKKGEEINNVEIENQS